MVQTSTIIIATAALSAASSLALPIELNEHTHFVREEDDLFARDGVSPGVNKLSKAGHDIPKYLSGLCLPPHILPKTGPTNWPLPKLPFFPFHDTSVGPRDFVSKIPVREHGVPLPKFAFPQTNLGRNPIYRREYDGNEKGLTIDDCRGEGKV